MIYTITFNPAVDLVVKVPDVTLGSLNRSRSEHYVAGGKGINMSVVLKRLGMDNTAIAFLGGFSGEYIKSELAKDNIAIKSITIDGITRINVKLKSNEETEINASGAHVSRQKFNELLSYFDDILQEHDIVFLAGNKAPGMDENDYVSISRLCQNKGVKLVLDTTQTLLTNCLPYEPFIIKPNHHELGDIFNVTLTNVEDIIIYAKKLQNMGAKNVLISRGKDGSLLLTENGEIYSANVPSGQVINSVGAGDSMLAGFMVEFLTSRSYEKALQKGAATGSATAFSTGIATKELIEQLLPQIIVKKLS